MASDPLINLWVLGLTLVMLAELNAPLAGLALSLTVASMQIIVNHELQWLVVPPMMWLWSGLLIVQFLADLFFVPATVRDRAYLNNRRYINAHLHARFQSLVRPFVGALAFAALPLAIQPQSAAVIGFVAGTGLYWTTAWIREQVGINRGSVILLVVETTKNIIGLCALALATMFPILALLVLTSWLTPVALWSARLQRERTEFPPFGGQVAPDDS